MDGVILIEECTHKCYRIHFAYIVDDISDNIELWLILCRLCSFRKEMV